MTCWTDLGAIDWPGSDENVYGIAFTAEDRLAIAGDNGIYLFAFPAMTYIGEIVNESQAHSLTADQAGHIYYMDSADEDIIRADDDGSNIVVLDSPGVLGDQERRSIAYNPASGLLWYFSATANLAQTEYDGTVTGLDPDDGSVISGPHTVMTDVPTDDGGGFRSPGRMVTSGEGLWWAFLDAANELEDHLVYRFDVDALTSASLETAPSTPSAHAGLIPTGGPTVLTQRDSFLSGAVPRAGERYAPGVTRSDLPCLDTAPSPGLRATASSVAGLMAYAVTDPNAVNLAYFNHIISVALATRHRIRWVGS